MLRRPWFVARSPAPERLGRGAQAPPARPRPAPFFPLQDYAAYPALASSTPLLLRAQYHVLSFRVGGGVGLLAPAATGGESHHQREPEHHRGSPAYPSYLCGCGL